MPFVAGGVDDVMKTHECVIQIYRHDCVNFKEWEVFMSRFPKTDNAEEYVQMHRDEQLQLPLEERSHNIPFFGVFFEVQIKFVFSFFVLF